LFLLWSCDDDDINFIQLIQEFMVCFSILSMWCWSFKFIGLTWYYFIWIDCLLISWPVMLGLGVNMYSLGLKKINFMLFWWCSTSFNVWPFIIYVEVLHRNSNHHKKVCIQQVLPIDDKELFWNKNKLPTLLTI